MKNILLLSIILFIFNTDIKAHNPIEVSYISGNEEVMQLANMMDIDFLVVNIKGELKGKKIMMKENVVNDGIIKTEPLSMSYLPMKDDSVTIKIMSRKLTADSVKIDIRSSDIFYYTKIYDIKSKNKHILMETKLEEKFSQNIPIFAYTPGISKIFNVNGTLMDGIDYCGLRDIVVR